jgi:hypothetical protein
MTSPIQNNDDELLNLILGDIGMDIIQESENINIPNIPTMPIIDNDRLRRGKIEITIEQSTDSGDADKIINKSTIIPIYDENSPYRPVDFKQIIGEWSKPPEKYINNLIETIAKMQNELDTKLNNLNN